MLGKIVVDDQDILMVAVHKLLGDRTSGIRRDILQRRRLGSTGRHDDGIFHRIILFQSLCDLDDIRHLLADGHVYAEHVLAALVDDRIQCDRCLTGLSVADDQLTLSASDRCHGIDRRDTGLQRFTDRRSLDNTRCRRLDRSSAGGSDDAFSVDRITERIDNTSEHTASDWNGNGKTCTVAHNAFDHISALIQKNDADGILFQVHGNTVRGLREHDKFAGHTVGKTVDLRHTVTYGYDLTDLLHFGSLCEIGKDLISLFFLLRRIAFPQGIVLKEHGRIFFKIGKRRR